MNGVMTTDAAPAKAARQAPAATPAGPPVEAGIFLVDKPVGPTSFRVVQQVRRALGIRKVGHAGTLDPFASGLLVVCAGRPATRIISRLMEGEKEYEATLKLGIATDTFDLDGRVVEERPVPVLARGQIERCLAGFVGEQMQAPPNFSALKHKGKPLYFYARQGIAINKAPRRILIHELECRAYGGEELSIRVVCSKGTYIRTLASDIGAALGCGAHLTALRRLRSGPFHVDDAVDGRGLLELEEGRLLLLDNLLAVNDVLNSLTSE